MKETYCSNCGEDKKGFDGNFVYCKGCGGLVFDSKLKSLFKRGGLK